MEKLYGSSFDRKESWFRDCMTLPAIFSRRSLGLSAPGDGCFGGETNEEVSAESFTVWTLFQFDVLDVPGGAVLLNDEPMCRFGGK